MKKLLVFTILFITTALLNAQEIYFHELRGMEDSTGTTHLFYRLYESNSGCGSYTIFNNHIYHFDTSLSSDSVLIREGANTMQYFDECYYSSNKIIEYEFLGNNPNHYVYSGVGIQLDPSYYISHSNNTYIETGFIRINDIEIDFFSDSIFFSTSQYELENGFTFKTPLDDLFWYSADYYLFDSSDSLIVDYSVSDINPYVEGTYFQIDAPNGFLLKSLDKGKSYTIVESTLVNWTNMSELSFSSSSNTIYSIGEYSDHSFALVKSDSLGEINSWSIALEDDSEMFFSLDSSEEGSIYLTKNDSVFISKDHSETFSFLIYFEDEIKGIYKKPGFDLFYVLTTEELFQVENGAITSLKKLPVSNEEESKVIPNSIVLHQNYPNPFNPSTTISFELKSPVEVTLTVFDALGRTISVLVNDRRHSGFHQIAFDASNLSSGIYFYRLETENLIETKRLTLIK